MEFFKNLIIFIRMFREGFRLENIPWNNGGYSIDFKNARQLVDFDRSADGDKFFVCCAQHIKTVDRDGRLIYDAVRR